MWPTFGQKVTWPRKRDTHHSAGTSTVTSHESPQTFWERVATTKWGSYVSRTEQDAIVRAATLSNPSSTVLDLGCEGGRWSILLSCMGRGNIVCAEVDANALKMCHERLPSALCIQVDPRVDGIPCKAGSVGFILCVEVPPVAHSSWFIDECLRVLSTGGVMLTVIQNSMSYRALVRKMLSHVDRRRAASPDPLYKVNYRAWGQTLREKGFEILYETGFCWLPFSRSSDFIFIPQLVKIEKYLSLDRLTTVSPWVVCTARKL
jgi:2-polyprenyl-3-methyl-5-hydroxy-6-metoxy-1,4-benzoquinol methylase